MLLEFTVLDLRHVAWDGQFFVRLTARNPELCTPKISSIYNFQTTFPPPLSWWEWPPLLDGSDPNFIFIPFVKLAITYGRARKLNHQREWYLIFLLHRSCVKSTLQSRLRLNFQRGITVVLPISRRDTGLICRNKVAIYQHSNSRLLSRASLDIAHGIASNNSFAAQRRANKFRSLDSLLLPLPATRHNDQVALLVPRSLSPIGHHHTYHPRYTAYSSTVSISFHPTFLFIERVHLGRNVSCGETKRRREGERERPWLFVAFFRDPCG